MGYSDPPWEFKGKALYQLSLVKVEEVCVSGSTAADVDDQSKYHGDLCSVKQFIFFIIEKYCRQGNMSQKISHWSIFLVGHLVAST